MPDGALRVLHGATLDVETEAGFLAPGQMLVLRLVLCARGRNDVIDAVNADTGERHRFRLWRGVPHRGFRMRFPPRRASPRWRRGGHRHPCRPTTDLPGLESGAQVETPDGPTPVERIRPGTTVLSDDGEEHVVRWIDTRDRLCIGRSAPVMLRAPYFGLGADICVTPDTRLKRRGADVEYLAGTETVLVRAADLVSGPAARFERSRPLRRFHHIMLDDPACLHVWRCRVETAFLSEVLASQDGGASAARPDAKDCVAVPPASRPHGGARADGAGVGGAELRV
jgi:hypothetical protein